jgi:UPF0755 protein
VRVALSAAATLIALALLTAIPTAIALVTEWRASLDRTLELPEGGLTLVIPPGRSFRHVVGELRTRGVVGNPELVLLATRLSGEARRIQAGEYAMVPGTTLGGLLQNLVSGRVIQHAITVVEGWTFRQLLEAVRRHPAIVAEVGHLPAKELMDHLGAPGVHPEGRFLPETYFFPRGASDLEVLRRAHHAMGTLLAQAWAERAPGLPLETPDQALVVASIVEKETGVAEERPRVAGVLLRRLARGMLLQADPTLIYGLGADFDGNLRREDLRRDTPYNTYLRTGLPPTPIALPGRDAIRATLNPDPGSALYFVARGDGTHHFSASLDEHRRAVARYQLARPSTPAGEGDAPR